MKENRLLPEAPGIILAATAKHLRKNTQGHFKINLVICEVTRNKTWLNIWHKPV
jgi:hypothetical protein